MREILFRGKTEFNTWVTGSLIQVSNYCCILSEDNGENYNYPYLDGELGTIDGMATPIQPETIGQYTGLTDKNGTKIFEGDIIKIGNKIRFVFFGAAAYRHTNFGEYASDLTIKDANNCEVIGNIHDNLELLKGGESL